MTNVDEGGREIQRQINVIPSPYDPRDHLLEQVYADLRLEGAVAAASSTTPTSPPLASSPPPTLDLRPQLMRVKDQGQTDTCAAQTAACIKEYQEFYDTQVRADFSPQYVYNNRVNKPDAGMYGRDVMRIMHELGVATENSYPFGSTQDPSDDVIAQAKEYRVKEYARVQTIDGAKEALYRDGPLYISFPVFNKGISMWKPRPNETQQGGHAMTVVGYNTKGFIIRNSWGDKWGDKGHCIYPYEDFGAHWEIWATVDRKGSRAPEPSVPPRKKLFFGLC